MLEGLTYELRFTLDPLRLVKVVVVLRARVFIDCHVASQGKPSQEAPVEQVARVHFKHHESCEYLTRHHRVSEHQSSDEELAGILGPVSPPDHMHVKDAESETDEVEEDVGSHIGIPEALIEEFGVQVEVSNALVAVLAVFDMLGLLGQAD